MDTCGSQSAISNLGKTSNPELHSVATVKENDWSLGKRQGKSHV
jgi:hypothetical protein